MSGREMEEPVDGRRHEHHSGGDTEPQRRAEPAPPRRDETKPRRHPEVAFVLAPIDVRRPGRSVLPLVALVAVFAGLAGTAWLARASDRPETPATITTSTRPDPTTAQRTPQVLTRPQAQSLVLTSPSHDGATYSGREVPVVGYVLAGLATVSIALDDGTTLHELGAFVPAPVAGDPAAEHRSWFSTSILLAPGQTGRLWLEVQAFASTGEPVVTVRRSLEPRARSAVPSADSPVLGGRRPGREQGTDGLIGGIVFRRMPED